MFAFFIGLCGFAQTASLEVLSDPTIKNPFFLSINGVRQNEAPVENIVINGLPYEVYGVELELANQAAAIKHVVFLRIGKTTNYVLSPGTSQFKLIEGQGEEKPYNKQSLVLNYKALTDTTPAITEAVAEQFADFAAPPINFDDDPENNQGSSITPAQKDQLIPSRADQSALRIDADSMFKSMKENIDREFLENNDLPCTGAVSSENIRNLKVAMKELKSLRERYNIAQKGIANLCLTVGQLKELMRLLDGDDLKIEFYREIYKNLIDFARRSDLFELFFFETSIDEIQNLQ